MKKDDIIVRLINEFGYPEVGANLVWLRLEEFSPEVLLAFSTWWEENTIPNIEVQGYTIERLISEHSMNLIAALLTIDWLLKEPEKAIASLKKGHDKMTSL